jgi:hypothetical protein
MTDDDHRYMQDPATAVVVGAEAANVNVFGFVVAFPRSATDANGNVQLQIHSGPHAPHEVLDAKLCKDYATQVVDALLKRGREDLVRTTNWASVAACISKIIVDWNGVRTLRYQGPLQ